MDYLQSLQTALDYMEDNLLEQITYEDVAKHLHMSNFYFHNIFRMTVGVTANEYIRNRRLTLAGQELMISDSKVVEIAFKYCYGTHESFTKAFSRFHGITPHAASKGLGSLKSFDRLKISIQLQGGDTMNYRIEKKEKFQLISKTISVPNEAISDDDYTGIRDLWTKSSKDGTMKVLSSLGKTDAFYGLCQSMSDDSTTFNYGIGVVSDEPCPNSDYDIWKVQASLWAVFPCHGDTPDCIGTTWTSIHKEFLPTSDFKMLDQVDFELYSDDLGEGIFCEVWIPVIKK